MNETWHIRSVESDCKDHAYHYAVMCNGREWSRYCYLTMAIDVLRRESRMPGWHFVTK